jgi:hypothetical protein
MADLRGFYVTNAGNVVEAYTAGQNLTRSNPLGNGTWVVHTIYSGGAAAH